MATYISNGSGNWTTIPWLTAATGTFGPTAPAAGSPPSFGLDKIVIRSPHVVIYNTSGVFGDGGNGGTGTTSTVATASIILSGGTLRASRTQNTALTAIGVIWVTGSTAANNSFLDWGTLNDPVSAFTSTISMSCAGGIAGWAGIHIQGGSGTTSTSNSACFCGLEKTRNTFLSLSAAAGQPVITVDSCRNWVNNDLILIESDTTSTSRTLSARISNISGNTITLDTNVNFARLLGTRVGNFTSTVTYKTLESSPLAFGVNLNENVNGIYQFSYMTFENVIDIWRRADNTGNMTTLASVINRPTAQYALTQPVFRGIAFQQTTTIPGNIYGYQTVNVPYDEVLLDDIAYNGHTASTSRGIANFGSNSVARITNSVCYRASTCYVLINSYKVTINNCYLNSENYTNAGSICTYNTLNNCRIRTNNPFSYWDNIVNFQLNSCNITSLSSKTITTNTINAFGDITLNNCTLNSSNALLSSYASDTPTVRTLIDANYNVFNPNNNNTYTTFNYFHHATTNSSIRKNGLASLSFRPKIPNTAFVKTFTVAAIQGVTQKIKGNLRFDSAYGNTTPPSITFGGAVATTTYTSPAVANTWNSFEYDFTPTYTGDIEIKLTGTSTLSTGFVYLDGLNLDPFIKDTRWYGYQVDKNAYRTVDTLTTLTENQVSSVDITNLDRLYDASNYWTISNPLSTSYLDLYTRNGTVLDFGNKNIVVNNSASTNFAYASASNTITIKTPMLSAGNNFNTLKTTGNVTLTNGDISFITINGNVFDDTPVSLSGVNVNQTLIYNTNSPDPTKITFTNCNVLSATNLGTANVVIKKLNSTVTYA